MSITDTVRSLVQRYSARGVLLDSNLLLVWLIGRIDRDMVSRFKRTSRFTAEDYDNLAGMCDQFGAWYTTPHVLTEVSNLGGTLKGDYEAAFRLLLRDRVKLLRESALPSADIVNTPAFLMLGLTDAALVHVARTGPLLVTVDLDLARHVQRLGLDVLNFTNVQGLRFIGSS